MRRSVWTALLVALLGTNAAYYAIAGTTSKAVDAAAWLLLLVLFTMEGAFARAKLGARTRAAVRLARLVAAAAVVAATIGYVFEDDVLDAINSVAWIGVVVLLEIEFRRPTLAARARRPFTAVACVLYGSLAALVLAWALRGEWFDAYDAALWLTAFATIELEAVERPA